MRLRILTGLLLISLFALGAYFIYHSRTQSGSIESLTSNNSSLISERLTLKSQNSALQGEKSLLESSLSAVQIEFEGLKSQDQLKINIALEEELKNIRDTYKKAAAEYEDIVELKDKKINTTALDKLFAQALSQLSERNYASSATTLAALQKKISEEEAKTVIAFKIPVNVPAANAPPGSGYRRQQVTLDIGNYLVDIVTADLNSTRVIVDTATDGDCRNDCPVLSLAEYVSRNGAFAGINGSYFCPASYPSCAGKTNSFDTLAMNKNKKYINSDNNVYSNLPAVIFQGNSARFVGRSLEWGRDTGVDAVLANQPLLVSGGQVVFGGGSDPKQGSRGTRSFVGASGNMAYIGVVHNATVAEVARVLAALGIQGALNLDSGGSTALWSGGYKAGPGRNIPNALLFVRK